MPTRGEQDFDECGNDGEDDRAREFCADALRVDVRHVAAPRALDVGSRIAA